jgi:hypothetical protein
MQRRQLLSSLGALAAVSAVWPAHAAVGPAHQDVASALFELYAAQSVRLSITNAIRQRPPGTDAVLAPQAPAMLRALERHRAAFLVPMSRAVAAHVPGTLLPSLTAALQTSPPTLDDQHRRLLFDVDAEFRREAQAVIGAMTTDIALMIAATLAEQSSRAR